MTPVTRYLLADDVDACDFAARLIRKVRALNFTVIAHCGDAEMQKQLIQALNRLKLEPQLEIQSGAIAICENAHESLAATSHSTMLKLVRNSLLLNLNSGGANARLTQFSRFERYAEIQRSDNAALIEQAQWFSQRGYPLQDHNIFDA